MNNDVQAHWRAQIFSKGRHPAWLGNMDSSENDNALHEELRQMRARLQTLEQERVHEKARHEELLQQLQSALKIKSEFVAHVSHELRTPLNGMLPMVEMLLRCDLTPTAKEYATTLKEAGNSLLSIINDVLQLSKIEAGKVEVEDIQFDLISVVEGAALILAPAAASKNLLLLTCIDSNVPDVVSGDPQRLRQVLLNLCSNAIKFTDVGQIVLKVSYTQAFTGPDHLIFQIADSGSGLSDEIKNHLFEPFFQGSDKGSETKGGTGLGLSISKHLVELMKGKFFVESAVNEGSTFGFHLPIVTKANIEIEKVWGASTWPQTSEKNIGKINALSLEPVYKGQSVICETLKTFEFGTRTTDNAQNAIAILTAQSLNPTPNFVVFLDMVRGQKQSNIFLELLQNSSLANSIKVIEVVAQEGAGSRNSGKTYSLGMPMRRQSVYRCLNRIENKPWNNEITRSHQSTTLGINALDGLQESAALLRSENKKQVLIADDNKINQRVLMLFLQDLSFSVDIASDGVEAVQFFKNKHYDLVFLDCQMPRLNGYDSAKIIKEIQQRRGILTPVIAVTASALEGTREECMANHMDDYLCKPINPDDLEKLATKWLGHSVKRQKAPWSGKFEDGESSLPPGSSFNSAVESAAVDRSTHTLPTVRRPPPPGSPMPPVT